ncbi:hypothetical protein [Haloglomus salinum]|uniref:hypothetical protein n=1 Tax=Haloglomus salinum TaxID=2962673 RepID=UPI0020C9A54B|nr:hypothetical protein [Haloglomus salinum]
MSDWFETAGERGVLELMRRDGSWYVAEPSPEATVKVLGTASGTGEEDQPARRRLRGTVSSYKRGADSHPDMLFLTDVATAPDTETGSVPATEDGPTTSDDESTTGSANGTAPTTSHGGESPLERIAREHLDDHEVRIEGEEESLVGSARRRASDRQRAPAIDPRLQGEDSDISGG